MCLSSIENTNFRSFLGHCSPWASSPSALLLQCSSPHPFCPPSRLQIQFNFWSPTWRNRVALFRPGTCNVLLFDSALYFVCPLLFACAQTYGSAISSPSNASGVATFDSIGLFDLPNGALFQVFFVVWHCVLPLWQHIWYSSAVSGCFCIFSWCVGRRMEQHNSSSSYWFVFSPASWVIVNLYMYPGVLAMPYYRATNIITSCRITRQPSSAIPQKSNFFTPPFTVLVGNGPIQPYRYVIASVHIVVRQNGVVLAGANAIVDPASGTASLARFKLISALNDDSLTYDVVSNGVTCTSRSSILSPVSTLASIVGNSVRIGSIPSAVFSIPNLERGVVVGVQSASLNYNILDANEALLVGVIVQIKVWFCCSFFFFTLLHSHLIELWPYLWTSLSNSRHNSFRQQALNTSIVLQGLSGQATPQSVSSPPIGILQFVVVSAVTGTYELCVWIFNHQSFVNNSKHLTSPQRLGCSRQYIFSPFFVTGHKSSAVHINLEATSGFCGHSCATDRSAALSYNQQRPFNCGSTGASNSGHFLRFRRIAAVRYLHHTSWFDLRVSWPGRDWNNRRGESSDVFVMSLYELCDSISLLGSSKSLLSFLHFRNIIPDIATRLCEGCLRCCVFHRRWFLILQVTNQNIPKLSQLNDYQTITWSVVLAFLPIGAMNNSESGAFVWLVGLGSFLYFCSVEM